ncbi:hypothetical protein C8Q76DRAFT_859932 [Earliella scabrosa]|nr:hypothetical protein C8Q76DRAFT_859932 [Earliella scabrosa]
MGNGSIIIRNESSREIKVFVTKWTNKEGDEGWWPIAPGQRDSWLRNGWECVGIKDSVYDNKRDGRYVAVNTVVVFKDFGDIELE